jgi:hypothetical protein
VGERVVGFRYADFGVGTRRRFAGQLEGDDAGDVALEGQGLEVEHEAGVVGVGDGDADGTVEILQFAIGGFGFGFLYAAFDFADNGRTYACRVEAPRGGRAEAWWWFTVSGDDARYAPFPAAADDTQDSVRSRVVAYYEERLAREHQRQVAVRAARLIVARPLQQARLPPVRPRRPRRRHPDEEQRRRERGLANSHS